MTAYPPALDGPTQTDGAGTVRNRLSRAEARERARLLDIHSYRVELDLSAALSQETFPSITEVRFACEGPATSFIDLRAVAVHSVVLNGMHLSPSEVCRDGRITLPELAAENVLCVVAYCAYSRDGAGMHRFVDPADGFTYLYTQFEVAEASRVFAVFDQPDLKAPFTFTVTTPPGWVVVGNAPAPAPRRLSDGSEVHAFAPTRRIPSYVVAVAAGPYSVVRDTHREADREIPLALYCRASLTPWLDAGEIFPVLRRGLGQLRDLIGHDYPFEKYDHVFVPEFNSSAMENAAAVTMRDQFLFRSRATGAALAKREMVILHELAHMWFGDLVTIRWWGDLWLNESFATYFALVCQSGADDMHGDSVRAAFAAFDKNRAYLQDELPSAHAIAADVEHIADVEGTFDSITYVKGAAVLRQLSAAVGATAFRQGIHAYLREHAWGNADVDDLLRAIEGASSHDLATWSEAWLRTAGVDMLRPEVAVDGDGTITSFTVAKTPSPRSHQIAVGLYDISSRGLLVLAERIQVAVHGDRTEVPGLRGRRRPALMVLNDGDQSYARTRMDPVSLTALTRHIGGLADPVTRALCWAMVWDMTRNGELAATAYLDLLIAGADREGELEVLGSLQHNAKVALNLYADPDTASAQRVRWADHCLDRLRRTAPGSDRQLAWFHAFAAVARSEPQVRVLHDLLDGLPVIEGMAVDHERRWAALHRLAATGHIDRAAIAAEVHRAPTASALLHAAAATAALPEAEAKADAWAAIGSSGTGNAERRALIAGFCQPEQSRLLEPYVRRYFAGLGGLWHSPDEAAQRAAAGLFPSYVLSSATLAAADEWLAQPGSEPALRRVVLEGRARVERALNAHETARSAGRTTPRPDPAGADGGRTATAVPDRQSIPVKE
ncbi:aminopeptidase N [Catellatospora chokoriensis]|uniref:aminopeptidase N n=1 Tax=Catellatospora chokoriensis TaxID=310353 RepID=UPI0019420254|nr:aminopeptidase N [Catellatospora chokoriensis]